MSLGYALLHADRIAAAVGGPHPEAIASDEGVDIGVAALAIDRPEALIQEYLRGVMARFDQFVARMQGAFEQGAGVLGDIRRALSSLLELDFDNLRLTPLVDRLGALVAALDPAVLAQRLRELCDRMLVIFPELNGGALLDTLLDIGLGGLDVLERPRLDGRDDVGAHRAFRAARIVRAWIGQALSSVRERLAQFDLETLICDGLQGLLANPHFDSAALRAAGEQLSAVLRPLAVAVDALLAIRVSVNVSVSASVSAGAQPDPNDPPIWIDDDRVAPHDWRHGLWWTDMLTSVTSVLMSVFDIVNYNAFVGPRAADAVFGVIGVVWNFARGLLRALRPDFLKSQPWNGGGAFWFSELGDFCVQAFLALLGSFHEVKNLSNFVMSFAVRLGRYYTFSLGPRLPYIIARAIWYARSWANEGWVLTHTVVAGDTLESVAAAKSVTVAELRHWNRLGSDEQPAVGTILIIIPPPEQRRAGEGRSRPKFSFARYSWLGWGFLYVFGALGGLFQKWEWLDIMEFFGGDGAWSRWLMLGLGLVAAIIFPWLIAGTWPWDAQYEIDKLTFGIYVGFMLLMSLVIMGSMASTNATRGVWWISFIIIGLVALGLILPVALLWNDDNPDETAATHVLYWWSLLIGFIVFGLIPAILWMYYIDDGRDREGAFNDKPQGTTPYKLPYPKGDVWNCGQGIHGMWSHTWNSEQPKPNLLVPGNHFGYDFLECQDRPASAARGGLVVSILQANDYGKPDQNDVEIQHLDWVEKHDPGSDLERVQTYSHYIHIGPENARIDINQYVVRGQNIVDIDSTGISAQQHLHFGATFMPRTRFNESITVTAGAATLRSTAFPQYGFVPTLPVVFADPSLSSNRSFPLLRFLDGLHNPGRPRSGILYESDNTVEPGTARPIRLRTQVASPDGPGGAHQHWLEIDVDAANMPLDGKLGAATSTLKTSAAAGHTHDVSIDADKLRALLNHRLPENFASASALAGDLAHTHGFEPEPFTGGPGAAGIGSRRTHRANAPIAQLSVTAPPPGQALARTAGPYDLLGKRLLLRVDDSVDQAYFFAGDRGHIIGGLAPGRGPRTSDDLTPGDPAGGAAPSAVQVGSDRRSVCDALEALDAALGAQPWVLRPEPVLILETKKRGSGARLQIKAASAGARFGLSADLLAAGSGTLADQQQLTQAELTAIFVRALNQTPVATPPGAVTANHAGGNTRIDFAGTAVAGTGNQRLATVFSTTATVGRYDGGTRRLTGAGSLPLGAGHLQLVAGGNTLVVPITGTPAWLDLDPATAWLQPAQVAGSTLYVAVGASEVGLRVPASTALPALARLIMLEVEGLRAWEQGGHLHLETVDVGAGLTLRVRKAKPAGVAAGSDFDVSATGEAPSLAGPVTLDDSAMIQRSELVALINDAATRASAQQAHGTAVTAGTAFAVTVGWSGNKLQLTVPSGHTIALDRAKCSQALLRRLAPDPVGGADPNFTAVDLPDGRKRIESRALPAPIRLDVGGWLDVLVDGTSTRVHLDAEPARLELGPVDHWFAAGEQLELRLSDVPADPWVTVTMHDRGSLGQAAAAISAALPELMVRVGYRVALEHIAIGGDGVHVAGGRPEALGFVARTLPSDARGGLARDCMAVGQAGAADFSGARFTAFGKPTTGFTATVTGTAPNQQVQLAAEAGHELRITASPADPFGFGGVAQTVSSAGFATRPLGDRRAIRYHVELRETGNVNAVGEAWLQLMATPAVLRGTRPLGALPLIGASLNVRISGGPRPINVDVDLGWASTVQRELGRRPNANLGDIERDLRARIVAQLQREVPLLRAWFIPDRDANDQRHLLQLETVGAGTGWGLRLEGEAALLALGFDPAVIAAGVIDLHGRGNVANEAAVTPSELRDAFHQVAARVCVSRSEGKYHVPAILAPAVPPAPPVADANKLILEGQGARLTLSSDPPDLLAAMTVTTRAGNDLEIDVANPLELLGGRLSVARDGAPAAIVPVYGSRAGVRSPGALPTGADLTRDITVLQGMTGAVKLDIIVDGTTTTVTPFPAGIATLDAALAYLADRVPAAHFGLRPSGTGAGTELLIESRRRGTSSTVDVRFINVWNGSGTLAHGLLGFAGVAANVFGTSSYRWNATGGGSFANLEAVTGAELQAAFVAARDRGVVSQGLIAGQAPSATAVEIRALDPSADLNPAGLTPRLRDGSTITFAAAANRPDLLQATVAATMDLRADLLTIGWETRSQQVGGTATTRSVSAPLWARPARLLLGINPTVVTDFNGRRLALDVDGQAFTVSFAGLSTWDQLGLQIELASGWRMLARVFSRGGRRLLELTSASEGSAARLTMSRAGAGGGGDARDLLDDPADALVRAEGQGVLPRLDRASAAELADAIGRGFASAEQGSRRALEDLQTVSRARYHARANPNEIHLRVRSRRDGCMSAIEILDGGAPFDFEPSMLRGPASRAAAVLRGGPANGNFAGAQTLVIRFNDNGSGSDVAPPRDLSVSIPAGAYTRSSLAQTIHEQIFAAGAGMAARFPDDAIVIESLTPGLAGSVRLPQPGSSPEVVTALGLDAGAPTEARGWPGGGRFESSDGFATARALTPPGLTAGTHLSATQFPVRGLRAKAGPPTAGVQWRFSTAITGAAGLLQTPPLTLVAAWSADDLVREVDRILGQAAPGPRRIGHAKRGHDGNLHIEALEGQFLFLEVQRVGATALSPLTAVTPPGLGERVDLEVEPGLDLRATDTVRTYRYIYDRRGTGDGATDANFVDVGWLRPPTSAWGIPRQVVDFQPLDIPAWPRGRYLLAVRTEAAKHDYGGAGEMIVSAGSQGGVTYVHAARYWMALTCVDEWDNLAHRDDFEAERGDAWANRNPGTPPTRNWLRAIELVPVQMGVRSYKGEVLLDWMV